MIVQECKPVRVSTPKVPKHTICKIVLETLYNKECNGGEENVRLLEC